MSALAMSGSSDSKQADRHVLVLGTDPELGAVLGYPIGDRSSQARSSQPANMMPSLEHAVDGH